MSFVNSPSSDVSHFVDNVLNDSMPPAINSTFEEEEIPSENYLTPSATNPDPNMIHASMMNTANMLLTQHGVTPATNSMNFPEGEFSIGNPESRMMKSIVNRSVLKDFNEEIGDLRQHGGFTYSGDTNFQETSTRAGNHDTLSIANRSVLKDFNEELGDLRQHGGFTYSGDTNFQETLTRAGNHDTLTHNASMMNTSNMLLTQHGVTPATNSMNFLEGGFSVGNLKPRMIRAKMSIASTSHEVISEGQVNYSNQESEGLLNCNQMNDSMQSIGIKRSLEARGKGTEEQCNFHQSLEPKNKKLTLEQLGERDEKQINKIMTDRLNRQIELDKKSDMELVHTKQWPARQDVEEIRQDWKGIAKKYGLKTPGAKQKLLEVASKLEITQKAREDSGNPSTNMDHIVNNLGLYFDGRFIEAVKKKFSSDLGNGCFAMSSPLSSAFNDLENQVYVQGNKQVRPENFQGLPEELKKLHWGEIPSYLQPIASRIVKDFTKVEFCHTTALVLSCAAVKEMEDFPPEKLDLDMLKKWGATLKEAKEVGFQVEFADDLLRKNLLAFFANTQILGGG
ncbi:hypothetical protein ES319_D11G380300v1 [Gossypium barbadense]|uniref:Uncharacterized protein n=1 Tax=Gossypium barbadense TaxID=3634 RepID=A0A5J5PJI0_GOSBA|nr:hypothetical protein ES319_D11G380300v1 [Gossypium barbadense]KAB2006907.1 hypothetical protein ES319_D11G380300v1 [Gossypium barbadense]